MDARNLIGLFVFIVFAGLVHYRAIDAIFKANEPEDVKDSLPEEMTYTGNSTSNRVTENPEPLLNA
jgi:hypothetical protein